MGEDAKPPIQFVIKTFKWRAFRRQLGAYGFLLLMLAGIGAAAYVFIQAKEITERETTTTDTTTKISALKKSMNDNDLKFKEEYNSRNALFVNMIKELPMKPKEDCKKLVQFGPPEGDWTEIFFTNDRKLKPKSDVVKKFLSNVNTEDCISIKMSYLPTSQNAVGVVWSDPLILDIEQLKEMKSESWISQNPFS